MSFFHDTPDNIGYLANGLSIGAYSCPQIVAEAWLRNEGQSVNNPTNPLNILYGNTNGQTGRSGRFGVYPSPHAGLNATIGLILGSSHYGGIRKALLTGDPVAIARAIEDSPYAGGHYGGGGSKDGNITRYVQQHTTGNTPDHPAKPAGAIGFLDAVGVPLFTVKSGTATDLGIHGNVHGWVGPAVHYQPNATLNRILTGARAGQYVQAGLGSLSHP